MDRGRNNDDGYRVRVCRVRRVVVVFLHNEEGAGRTRAAASGVGFQIEQTRSLCVEVRPWALCSPRFALAAAGVAEAQIDQS